MQGASAAVRTHGGVKISLLIMTVEEGVVLTYGQWWQPALFCHFYWNESRSPYVISTKGEARVEKSQPQ